MSRNASNPLRILSLLLFALVLSACGGLTEPVAPKVEDEAAGVNASLEAMSKLFARAVTDAPVRLELKRQVAKRFDGDTNVLYKTLTASSGVQPQSQGTDVRRALARAYAQEVSSQAAGTSALEAIDSFAKAIPHFQVAVPAHFDAWDAEAYTPLVGYAPAGVDERALREIRAFDAEGKLHLLDARTLPEKPVIILSQNERTDSSGALRPEFRAQKGASPEADTLTASYCRSVYVKYIRLYDDYEPWTSGSPEIMLSAYTTYPGTGVSYSAGFTNVDDEDYTYYVNRYIGCTTDNVTFSWYESDGSWTADDQYGAIAVPAYLFDGYTNWFYLSDMGFATN